MTESDTYRVSPFNSSSLSSHPLLNPPQMNSFDRERFSASLKCNGAVELARTARLWENELLVSYPSPFFLVRVADIRAALNSGATALVLYKEAQASIGSGTDPMFDEFVSDFEQYCKSNADNHRGHWSQGIFNQPWHSASKLRFPIIPRSPEGMTELQSQWATMKVSSGKFTMRFLRYLCIESNVLERIFSLTSQSLTRLTRDGFEENAVECTSESPLQEKDIIVEILWDTYKALELISNYANEPDKLTVEFLRRVHQVCMCSSKILAVKSKNDGDDLVLKYVNVGVTRQASQKNVMIPGPPRVQFCPFDKVLEELGKFTHLARQWLKNWNKNPFATAAWLHLVFTSCHPFEYGNGKVARLIASIPLIRAGLPPLCIPSNNKKTYFEGLHEARKNNYEPLVQCFARGMEISVNTIVALQDEGLI